MDAQQLSKVLTLLEAVDVDKGSRAADKRRKLNSMRSARYRKRKLKSIREQEGLQELKQEWPTKSARGVEGHLTVSAEIQPERNGMQLMGGSQNPTSEPTALEEIPNVKRDSTAPTNNNVLAKQACSSCGKELLSCIDCIK